MKTKNTKTTHFFDGSLSAGSKSLLLLCSAFLFMPFASAKDGQKRDRHSDYSYAEVIEVEPVFRTVRVDVPRRECWDEEVTVRDRHRSHRSHGSVGATIAGGLIGGVIGRQIGSGSGRDAMTVVGTLVGSAIAKDRSEQHHSEGEGEYRRERVKIVERCETHREIREEERIDGYRVTYVYDGREYTTRTSEDPGDKIRVRVSVTPSTR